MSCKNDIGKRKNMVTVSASISKPRIEKRKEREGKRLEERNGDTDNRMAASLLRLCSGF